MQERSVNRLLIRSRTISSPMILTTRRTVRRLSNKIWVVDLEDHKVQEDLMVQAAQEAQEEKVVAACHHLKEEAQTISSTNSEQESTHTLNSSFVVSETPSQKPLVISSSERAKTLSNSSSTTPSTPTWHSKTPSVNQQTSPPEESH